MIYSCSPFFVCRAVKSRLFTILSLCFFYHFHPSNFWSEIHIRSSAPGMHTARLFSMMKIPPFVLLTKHLSICHSANTSALTTFTTFMVSEGFSFYVTQRMLTFLLTFPTAILQNNNLWKTFWLVILTHLLMKEVKMDATVFVSKHTNVALKWGVLWSVKGRCPCCLCNLACMHSSLLKVQLILKSLVHAAWRPLSKEFL